MTLPPDLVTEIGSGDARRGLIAVRDRLAEQLERTDSARDVAALSLRLHSVLRDLADMEPISPDSPADRLRREIGGDL